jgi:uncharacterized damage-inducible protein DinB
MRYRIAVEDVELNHHVCWVLDLPGCFSSARDRESAVVGAPSRIVEYFAWIARHDSMSREESARLEVDVVEVFESFPCAADREYLVNAFFEDDRRPLSSQDVETGLRLLEWTREDLLRESACLPAEELSRPIPGEIRGTIGGILEHVARAENWYLSRLGVGVDWSELPEAAFGKLEGVRANTRSRLATLVGDQRVTVNWDERWSARKILRRTLWHERAHTEQIRRLSGRGCEA